MKKKYFVFFTIFILFLGLTAFADEGFAKTMYRLYNPFSGEHLYTESTTEKSNLVKLGWQDEGNAWVYPDSGNRTPVYRLYNPYNGDHHYTLNTNERDYLVTLGWRNEGIGFYSETSNGTPVYSLFNPYQKNAGAHHYTLNLSEANNLASLGWVFEGVAFYAISRPSPVIIDVSGWQVPGKINYDQLSGSINAAIVRVQHGGLNNNGGENGAQYANGEDKQYKTHLSSFQARSIPTAVYAYAMSLNTADIIAEADAFYDRAVAYNPTFWWIDVEYSPLIDNDARSLIETFRSRLVERGVPAEKIGAYIANHMYSRLNIDTSKFAAVWIPTYGDNTGFYQGYNPTSTTQYDLHQYTSRALLPGYDGNLDVSRLTGIGSVTFETLFSN